MSCRIVAGQFKEAHDIAAVPIEAWNIGLRTEGGHGEARVDEECYDDIARALRSSIAREERGTSHHWLCWARRGWESYDSRSRW